MSTMIHATISIRVAYDASSGTPDQVRRVLEDKVETFCRGSESLTGETGLIVHEWEHEVEVES